MSLIPLNDYVKIEPYREKETKAGILIPENTKDRPMRGTILAGRVRLFHDDGTVEVFGPGVEVIYSKFGTTDYKGDGEDAIFVRERDVMAVYSDAV